MAIAGKSIIVTGASSGFGAILASKLAERGARVALLARRKELLAALADDIHEQGGTALAIQCDVTDPDQVLRAVQETMAQFGTVDVLVNNAGILKLQPVTEMETCDLRAHFETNLFGVCACTRAVLPVFLAKSSGHVVNVSSMSAWVAASHWGAYAATKAALMRISQVWRWELAPKGILVTTVFPYYSLTELGGEIGSNMVRERFPFTPVQKPETVANAVVRAIEKRKREVFVPNHLRFWLIAPPLSPGLTDFLARKVFPFGWSKGRSA